LHKGISSTIDALKERGYTSRARKYLVFADDTKLCGIGQMCADSSATRNFTSASRWPLEREPTAGTAMWDHIKRSE